MSGNIRANPQYPSPEKNPSWEAQEQQYVERSRAAMKAGIDLNVSDTPSPVGARRKSAWPSPAEMGGGGPSALDVDAILASHDRNQRTSPRGGEGAAHAILAGREPLDVGAILASHDHARKTSPKAGEGAAATILAERRSPRTEHRVNAAADAAMTAWDGSTPEGNGGTRPQGRSRWKTATSKVKIAVRLKRGGRPHHIAVEAAEEEAGMDRNALLRKKGIALFLGGAIGPPPCGGRGDDGPAWVRYGSTVRAGFSAPGVVKTCQDRGHVEPGVGGLDDQLLLCVFDGHGKTGHHASAFIKENFASVFQGCLEKQGVLQPTAWSSFGGDNEMVRAAFVEAYEATDRAMCDTDTDYAKSGSTCVSVFFRGAEGQVAVANAGDSRAVLGSQRGGDGGAWTATDLSHDQVPENADEKKRIEEHGGRVERMYDWETMSDGTKYKDFYGPYRVWSFKYDFRSPGVAMARSIGDQIGAEVGVTCQPDVAFYDLDVGRPGAEDKVLIVASDGVWEFIKSQEAVELVAAVKAGGGDPRRAAEALADEAKKRWNEEEEVVDDITAIVAYLDHE